MKTRIPPIWSRGGDVFEPGRHLKLHRVIGERDGVRLKISRQLTLRLSGASYRSTEYSLFRGIPGQIRSLLS